MCSTVTGVCNGAVENQGQLSVDLTGLIWESQDEIASMFRILIEEPGALFDPQNGYVGSNDSQWSSDAIDFDGDGADVGSFNATSIGTNILLLGLTRTAVHDRNGDLKAGRAFIRDEVAFNQGLAVVDNPVALNAVRASTGLWLYRVLPEPSVVYLLIAGLILVRLFRQ